jgi:ubiquinone/menaquinone biosynthesis C-methylase UbiE
MNLRLFAHIQARASATEERRGGAKRRRQLLAGLSGRVVEVGAGSGVSFAHYPATVRELVAVEPERNLRERALEAAERTPVPVQVVDGLAERLPLPDASVDAVVLAGVLCSVPDPSRALDEAARVLRPRANFVSTSMSSPATVAWRGCSACSTRRSGRVSSAAATRAATPRRHSSPPGSRSRRASAVRFARPSSQRPSPPASSGARVERRLSPAPR